VRRATPASTRLAGALLLLRRQLAHGEPTIADYHRRRAETALSVLDSQLAHRNYLCAAEPTIADLFCYGDVAFAELCAFDLHRWTSAVNWTERLTALTGFVREKLEALLVGSDQYFDVHRDKVVALAAAAGIPAIYQFRDYPVAGGLISYGPDVEDAYYHAGDYVGQILNGKRPADLPVQQPTKFQLVVNLKTANALGLIVPPTLLARADEVID
jgi:hypothetical protein